MATLLEKWFGWGKSNKDLPPSREIPPTPAVLAPAKKIGIDVPVAGGRKSFPTYGDNTSIITAMDKNNLELMPHVNPQIISVLRKLCHSNYDLSQALTNFVELGNTGHRVIFDNSVTAEEMTKMNDHLTDKAKQWSDAEGSMDGLVNVMMSQIWISGALSVEWVPDIDLSMGVTSVVMVNPETIVFKYNVQKSKHEAYQRNSNLLAEDPSGAEVKLNPSTYKYVRMNGDTDLPYGIPPFLACLDLIALQRVMLDSLKYLAEQVGAGFLSVMVEQPDKLTSETDEQYIKRCKEMLDELSARTQKGVRSGTMVGFKDTTEIQFTSIARDLANYKTIFELNEQLIASGMKTDGTMIGRNTGTSETHITVVFSKLLSQLKNTQTIVKACLEFGYALELRLAGYKFKSLTVEFNPSTTVDKLKEEQAKEVKIRNLNALFYDGIINLDTYAREMGYSKADQKDVRFLRNNVQSEADQAAQREADKNKSDKKVRDKNKERPKKLCLCCKNDIESHQLHEGDTCPMCSSILY